MRRALLYLLILAAAASGGEPIRSGREIYRAECSGCHGDRGDGFGPASLFLPRRPRNFTVRRYKLRSTPSGSMPTRADLLATVTRGLPAAGMPGFGFLPEAERRAVVEEVLAFSGATRSPTPTAVSVPARPATTTTTGEAVYVRAGCARCHSPRADDAPPVPELADDDGQPLPAPDLTRDPQLSPVEPDTLALRLLTGLDGTPMPSYQGTLDGPSLWALADYLAAIYKPLPHARRFTDPRVEGERLAKRYMCTACHQVLGRGGIVGPSMDMAAKKLQVRWLSDWIAHPRARGRVYNEHPYRMPDLGLAPWEVEVLTAWVLGLAERSATDPVLPIPPASPADVAAGEVIYRQKCTDCHALGSYIPATKPNPNGPDMAYTCQKLDYGWLLSSIESEGLDLKRSEKVRVFMWQKSVELCAPKKK